MHGAGSDNIKVGGFSPTNQVCLIRLTVDLKSPRETDRKKERPLSSQFRLERRHSLPISRTGDAVREFSKFDDCGSSFLSDCYDGAGHRGGRCCNCQCNGYIALQPP